MAQQLLPVPPGLMPAAERRAMLGERFHTPAGTRRHPEPSGQGLTATSAFFFFAHPVVYRLGL